MVQQLKKGKSTTSGRKRSSSTPCRIRSVATIVLSIVILSMGTYIILWSRISQLHLLDYNNNNKDAANDPLSKQARRRERRERTMKRKQEAMDEYRLLKRVKKEVRERQNRTKHAFSPSTDIDFRRRPPLIPNLIREQKKQNKKTKTTTILTKSTKNEMTTDSKTNLFLNYQLHKDQPYNITYGQFTTCQVGVTTNKWGRKPVERVPLAPEMEVFLNDITTTIQTNLKLLSLGDSVGIQFHQILEEAAGALPQNRHVQHYAWGEHESVSVAAPIHGGGVLASFRMTGMFLKQNQGKPPPNAPGGGWLPEHVQELLQYEYTPANDDHDNNDNAVTRIDKFDAMIFRIPHGWLSLDQITKETVTESILMAHEWFGIRTAIVMTLYFNNNVETEDQLKQLDETNDMIRNLVANWDDNSNVQVLLLDFGKWAHEIMHTNARLAGMDQTHANYTLQRLGCMKKYPPSMAMVCTDVVPPGSCGCKRNMISIDGLHWCMESIGGRVVAAMACLLQCPLSAQQQQRQQQQDMKVCEQTCNDRFLNMEAIETLE